MLGCDARNGTCIVRDRNGKEFRKCVAKWCPNVFTFRHLDAMLPHEPDFVTKAHKDNNEIIRHDDNKGDEKSPTSRRSKREARGVPPVRMGVLGHQCDQHASTIDIAPFQLHESVQMSVSDIENLPKTFHEAVTGPEKHRWTPSVKSELKSLRDGGTFTRQKASARRPPRVYQMGV